MARKHRFRIEVASLAGLAVLAAGCSFSIGDTAEGAAEEVIEDDFGEEIGQDLKATCEEPPNEDVGTEFTCTATGEGDAVATFDAVVDKEDSVFVTPTNVLGPEQLAALEADGALLLESRLGAQVTIDCGTKPVILSPTFEMECDLNDAAGEATIANFEIFDITTGEYEVTIR